MVVPWIGLCKPIVRSIRAPACHAHPLVRLDPARYSDFLQNKQKEMMGPLERYGKVADRASTGRPDCAVFKLYYEAWVPLAASSPCGDSSTPAATDTST